MNHSCRKNLTSTIQPASYLQGSIQQLLTSGSTFTKDWLPPIFEGAAQSIDDLIQSSTELSAASLFGAASAACMGLYDIELLHGAIVPCAEDFAILAGSGERKSATKKLTDQGGDDTDKMLFAVYEEQMNQYRPDMAKWKLKYDALNKDYQKAILKGLDTSEIEHRRNIHLCLEPIKPKRGRIIYRDASPESVKYGLRDNHPLGYISMDEAGHFFEGAMVRMFELLSSLWDGSDLIVDRVTTGSFRVESPRFTISIMLQPQIFAESLKKKPRELRDSGLLARFLICCPASNQGYRTNSVESPDMRGLERFNARIRELLLRTFIDGGTRIAERQVLSFDERAKQLLKGIDQQIEVELLPGGRFCEMQDFASKMLEHICRLAGIFHVMDDCSGLKIGEADVMRACAIINWYADQFYNLVVLQMAPTQDQRDAETLLAWMQKYEQTNGSLYCTKGFLRKHVTNQLRDPSRLARALSILVDQRLVEEYHYNPQMQHGHPYAPRGKRGTYYRLVSSSYFGQQGVQYDYGNAQGLSPHLNYVAQ